MVTVNTQKIIEDKIVKRKKQNTWIHVCKSKGEGFFWILFSFDLGSANQSPWDTQSLWGKGQILFQVPAVKLSQNSCSVEKTLMKKILMP